MLKHTLPLIFNLAVANFRIIVISGVHPEQNQTGASPWRILQ